jgi:hypothetical protein
MKFHLEARKILGLKEPERKECLFQGLSAKVPENERKNKLW